MVVLEAFHPRALLKAHRSFGVVFILKRFFSFKEKNRVLWAGKNDMAIPSVALCGRDSLQPEVLLPVASQAQVKEQNVLPCWLPGCLRQGLLPNTASVRHLCGHTCLQPR